MTTISVDAAGVIDPQQAYTLEEARRRTGMGAAAMREARKKPENPLRILYVGKRGFVLGADLIAYLNAHGSTSYRD